MINVAWVNFSYADTRGPGKFFKEFMIRANQKQDSQIKYIPVFPKPPNNENMVKDFDEHNTRYYNCPIVWFERLCSKDREIRRTAFNELKENIETMVEILKKTNCDIVISNTSLSFEAAYAAQKLGIKHISFLRGVINPFDFEVNKNDFKIVRTLEKDLVNISDKIVTASQFTAKLWNINQSNDKWKLIPIGTECTGDYHPLPLDNGTLKVLTLSAIEQNKNIKYIIDVAMHLRDMGHRVEFNIYAFTNDVEYKKLLEDEIAKHELKDWVILHEDESNIDKLYLEHHVVFVPSILEGYGITVMEGAARCRPTISTKCGGPEETIVDGETGYLVPLDDAYGVAQKFEKFICDPNEIIRMGTNARKRWEDSYTTDMNIKKWESLITSCHCEKMLAMTDQSREMDTRNNWLLVSSLPDVNPSIKVGLLDVLNQVKKDNDFDYTISKPEDAIYNLDKASVVVFIRTLDKNILNVMHEAKKQGKKTIYYADDSLYDIPAHARGSEYYNSPEVQNTLKTFVENVDKVVTCSEWLSEAFNKKYNITSTWIEPSTEVSNIMPINKAKNKIVIGYAGNIDHAESLSNIKEAFLKLKKKYKDKIQFEFIGARPTFVEEIDAICYPPVSYPKYEMLMARRGWDIGIAYLEDTEFNNNKFINKYLEYSKYKIAGVYSDIPLYRRVIVDKVNGLFAKNDVNSWYKKIEKLIIDKKLRRKISKTSHEQVRNEYNPEVKVDSFYRNLGEYI